MSRKKEKLEDKISIVFYENQLKWIKKFGESKYISYIG